MAQKRPKSAPRRPQGTPRTPKSTQDAPRAPQKRPKRAQDGPKGAPRVPQASPKASQERPNSAPRGPKSAPRAREERSNSPCMFLFNFMLIFHHVFHIFLAAQTLENSAPVEAKRYFLQNRRFQTMFEKRSIWASFWEAKI